MNFTEIEIQYLTHEAQNSGRIVLNEFYSNVHIKIAAFREEYGGIPEANLYATQLRECAAAVVDVHVKRYIELAEELERYPDGEDLRRLSDFTRPYITKLLPRYREFAERPFGEIVAGEIVDAAEHALEFDLDTIFSEHWKPMLTLLMKGRVAEERSKSTSRSDANSASSAPIQQISNTFNAPVGAVQQGDNSSASVVWSTREDKELDASGDI